MSNINIVPSYPAPDKESLVSALQKLEGIVAEFQVDFVDGIFVPHISWPFSEVEPMQAILVLHDWKDKFALEFDCMIMKPEQYLDIFASLKISRLVVHYGSTDKYKEIAKHAQDNDYKLGLGITNDVPLAEAKQLVSYIDYVQVMGIKEVGAQGQSFDGRTLETIMSLKSDYPDLEIAVDGSVNSETIPALVRSGATRLAPGSAIIKAEDPILAYKQLSDLAQINTV